MQVHTIEYGCVDFEQDSLVGMYTTKKKALPEADRRAEEGVEDIHDESYRVTSDDDGSSIFCNDELIEWYRVETHDVEE